MKKYSQFLKELPSKTVVFAFGRFNPPTTGHELLVKAVKKLAASNKADHAIYASKSQDAKKNPLTVDKKVHYLNLMFPGTHFVAANEQERTFIEAVKNLNKKYKNIIMVAGSDRVPEYEKILTKYNGKDFNYDTIQVISAGERDPDADDASGMSASKMRAVAAKGDYSQFKHGLPSTMREIDGRRLMNDVRQGMGLEMVKEQINLVKDDLREQYFRGEIFNIGDLVESAGVQYEIVKRGSNHLLLKDESGKLVSKWLQDVSILEQLHLEESMILEELTDKTLKAADKIKVARIIATMLGIDNAESSANPEVLVNNALRKVRGKALNPEALKILDKMLLLATEVGIDFDPTLKPQKLKEGVIQPNGTDQITVATDSPVVNKNSKYNFAKDRLRYKDFAKLKKMNDVSEEVQIDESHVEFRIDHREKVKGDHKPTFADHEAKVSDTTDKATYIKVPSHKANSFKSAMKSKHGVTAELAEETTPYWKKQSWIKKMSAAAKQERLARERKEKEAQAAKPVKEEKEICSECQQEPCVCPEQIPGGPVTTDKPFDPFFKEDCGCEEAHDPVVDMGDYESDYDNNMDGEEISDEDFDKMVDEIDDIDDIIDVYDDEELAIVDDESGEELEDTDEEKAVNEESLMEVLSRMERMKAKMRLKRSQAKRERSTKIALRTYSGSEKINKRARRLAVKLMKKRLLRGRDAASLSTGEKERIERVIEKRKKVLGRLAMRLAPRVRQIEKARLSHKKFTKGAPNVSI